MLKSARSLVHKLSLLCSIESALIEKMEEIDKRMESIDSVNAQLEVTVKRMSAQYSEMMNALAVLRKDGFADFNARLRDVERAVEDLK